VNVVELSIATVETVEIKSTPVSAVMFNVADWKVKPPPPLTLMLLVVAVRFKPPAEEMLEKLPATIHDAQQVNKSVKYNVAPNPNPYLEHKRYRHHSR
jgi:hypothetical protein